MGRADHPKGNAEKLQKRYGQNSHYSCTKTQHHKFVRENKTALIQESQMLPGKYIARVLNDKEENRQEYGKRRIGEGASWDQVERQQEKHQ